MSSSTMPSGEPKLADSEIRGKKRSKPHERSSWGESFASRPERTSSSTASGTRGRFGSRLTDISRLPGPGFPSEAPRIKPAEPRSQSTKLGNSGQSRREFPTRLTGLGRFRFPLAGPLGGGMGAIALLAAGLAVSVASAVVAPGPPDAVRPQLRPGTTWPEPVAEAFAERIRREWPADRAYGAIISAVGLEASWPLATGAEDGAVAVPVVEGDRAEIAGRLALPADRGPRRVVILLDASSSANARVRFEPAPGASDDVTIVEAERRPLEHLLDGAESGWLELGVIAFGESTWPIAEPGGSAAELRAALARFRAEHPEGEGRTDAVCALWTASEWLDATPAGVAREIVVLTDGDAPVSGRFDARRRNTAPCPASDHRLLPAGGGSDAKSMAAFARRNRRDLRVTALVFEPDRRALPWHQLAAETGGEVVRAPSASAIDAVLPALVATRITRVFARNLGSGAETGELRQAGGAELRGALPLAPGA